MGAMTSATTDLRTRAEEVLATLAGPGARLREDQWTAVHALVAERRRALVVQRTGWGKSAVYFVATKLLREAGAGPTVIVSPLLALMRNQIEAAERAGIRAVTVNSANVGEWEQIYAAIDAGEADVLLLSPERLTNPDFRDRVLPRLTATAGMLVVDEAHYIKNPRARRSIRTVELIARADYAILLTGTPLENRVDEFRTLASYVRPDLTITATDLAPKTFRRQIAPAYLRRNQEDVLTELPELVEVEEWLPMSPADAARYRAAVISGNFMEMRQAAMLEGTESAKVRRLIEIVQEAAENERRVIVFSHFRNVLDLVARSLPGQVFGPLTGSIPASQRQQMVDKFSSAPGPAVLVAQIVAGGVGLNIQSASVVVICEPQLKPTTEAQAIARAHRMGQVHSVQVHRLLSEDSVDQRITELLATKKQVFDDFARVSDMANSAPEAVDLSEAELVRQVIAAERKRIASQA